jgi:predicted RNase H-like HicB family nuclease
MLGIVDQGVVDGHVVWGVFGLFWYTFCIGCGCGVLMGTWFMSYKATVIVELDDHVYYAWCPELPGCQTQGDTLEEALANAREAVELYLETLSPEERCECLNSLVCRPPKRGPYCSGRAFNICAPSGAIAFT